jgi:YVTN family beta-propeller protein
VYVANNGIYRSPGTVSVIDTATDTVTDTIEVGVYPYGVTVNPAGTSVYVTNNGDDTVSVIDTATKTVTATVNVGLHPLGVAVNPSGTKAYVANNYNDQFGNPNSLNPFNVSVIDTATNKVTTRLNVGIGPAAFGQFIGPETIGIMNSILTAIAILVALLGIIIVFFFLRRPRGP